MTTYNCGPYILEAIESIRRQTLPNWELLIADDGSDDGTDALLSSLSDPRIRVWTRPREGRAAALNFLLDEAVGPIAALMDADDVSTPDRLERAAGHLRDQPNLAGILSGHYILMHGKRCAPRGQAKSPVRCKEEASNFRLPGHDPTVVFRLHIGRSLRFSETLPIGSGQDFVFRLVETQSVEVIAEPLYGYRFRSGSSTLENIERREAGVRDVFDRALARRSMPPMNDAEFASLRRPFRNDPTNDLIGHFTDSAYLQVVGRNRLGALRTAVDAFAVGRKGFRTLNPLIYAMSPRCVARFIRKRRSGL